MVAIGGGGDAITAVALRRILHLDREPQIVSYSWDRLLIDPLPGPRTRADFNGLTMLAPDVYQVTPATAPVPPAGSSLPRLATEVPCRLLLLDPTRGAVDMARQIRATARHFGAEALVAVDVGGDALTDGTEAGLRSPLADQLALAACARTNLPTTLLVAAAGIDGELTADTLRNRFDQFGARQIGHLTADDMAAVGRVFNWHPSEASGLLAAASAGLRGIVEVRDAGDHVSITDDTCTVHELDLATVLPGIPAHHLLDVESLAQAEEIIRSTTGLSEIQYEARKAARISTRAKPPANYDLNRVDAIAASAEARGADFVSVRRLAELLGASTMDSYAALTQLLSALRHDHLTIGAYRTG